MSGDGAPGPPGVLHRRTLEFDAYDRGAFLAVVARFVDLRPWDDRLTGPVHDMELRVTVRKDDRMIVEAEATMRSFPHAECPAIEAAFAGLAGMFVGAGFVRGVAERFGGISGCTHLDQLARALGPAVIQSLMSAGLWAARRPDAAGNGKEHRSPGGSPVGSCHVWAEDGVAVQKLALGWKPGRGELPVPPLTVFRDRMTEHEP